MSKVFSVIGVMEYEGEQTVATFTSHNTAQELCDYLVITKRLGGTMPDSVGGYDDDFYVSEIDVLDDQEEFWLQETRNKQARERREQEKIASNQESNWVRVTLGDVDGWGDQ